MVIRVKVACVFGYVNYRLPLCQHLNRFVALFTFNEILGGNVYEGETVNQFLLLLLVVNDMEYLPGSSLKIRNVVWMAFRRTWHGKYFIFTSRIADVLRIIANYLWSKISKLYLDLTCHCLWKYFVLSWVFRHKRVAFLNPSYALDIS